ncbi:IS3 family transposase [Allisonella histaminiformans]|uniref:IS3 family transposase n=1 Tax=Allisonella histaminiformans TaxID=209880 RepID=UPI0039B0D73E
MLKAIVSLFNQSKGQYGVRRVYHELIHLGYKGNHEQIYHLMRMANLMGKRPGEKGKPKSYRGCVEKGGMTTRNYRHLAFSFILEIRKNFLQKADRSHNSSLSSSAVNL